MTALAFAASLLSYLLFLVRIAWQGFSWFGGTPLPAGITPVRRSAPARARIAAALDILFFRRIFRSSRLLWIFSWTFHLSFFLVLLRHTRYFCSSLPECLILFQPVGIFAGYLLVLSLSCLLTLRLLGKKDEFVSRYNYLIAGMLLLISSAGLVMRNFFAPDLISVKQFSAGIIGLHPQPLPAEPVFILHFTLLLLLLPLLPLHLLAAPLVTFEANRRKEELGYIIHDRKK